VNSGKKIADNAIGDFQHLKHQIQVPLEHSSVDHDDDAVRAAEQQEVPRNLFVHRQAQERVRARQIHEREQLAVDLEPPFGPGDRLSRPVADVLLEAGDRVEHRALAGIRITTDRYDVVGPRGQGCGAVARLWTMRAGSIHQRTGLVAGRDRLESYAHGHAALSPRGSISTSRVCSGRRAINAPRTR
jgi:hypothetical protein